MTPLHLAITSGSLEQVQLIVNSYKKENKARYVNCRIMGGFTPLWFAAARGHSDIATWVFSSFILIILHLNSLVGIFLRMALRSIERE